MQRQHSPARDPPTIAATRPAQNSGFRFRTTSCSLKKQYDLTQGMKSGMEEIGTNGAPDASLLALVIKFGTANAR